MIYAIIKKYHGNTITNEHNLYNNVVDLNRDLWNPENELHTALELKIKGCTYITKKNFLKYLAVCFQMMNSQIDENDLNLSWYEISKIQNYFEKNAKRYGLTKEFKENRII